MKRVIIVHGWEGSPDTNWLPWMKKELEYRGFEVSAPVMPDTHHPTIDAWVAHLKTTVPSHDTETYFIGHSIGCQAIARYVAETTSPIGGALFVAGWFTLAGLETEEEKEVAKPWMETPIDYVSFRAHSGHVVALLSDDDPFVPLNNADAFKEKMGAEVVITKGAGHFTGEETGVMEFPIILETFLKLAHAN